MLVPCSQVFRAGVREQQRPRKGSLRRAALNAAQGSPPGGAGATEYVRCQAAEIGIIDAQKETIARRESDME